MVEDIVLDTFPKEAGVYMFKISEEVIYVGSSNNLYMRMVNHRSNIRKGGNHSGTSKQDLYQFLQSNHFTVEFQTTDNYRQLEQKLVEQYTPKYKNNRAYTGLGAKKGREAEYRKQYNKKYQYQKQYYESNKEEIKQQKKQYQRIYDNQLCLYNGETLTLCALSTRFRRKGIEHYTLEAKKYIKNNNPIEFYDIYP